MLAASRKMSFNVTGVTTMSLGVLFPNAGDDRLDVSADEQGQHPPLGARLPDAFDASQDGGRRAVERGQDAPIARLQLVEGLLEHEASASMMPTRSAICSTSVRRCDEKKIVSAGVSAAARTSACSTRSLTTGSSPSVGSSSSKRSAPRASARTIANAVRVPFEKRADVLALGNLERVEVPALDLAAPVREERPRDPQDLIDGHSGPGAAILADMGGAPPNLDRGTFVAEREAQNPALAARRPHHAHQRLDRRWSCRRRCGRGSRRPSHAAREGRDRSAPAPTCIASSARECRSQGRECS